MAPDSSSAYQKLEDRVRVLETQQAIEDERWLLMRDWQKVVELKVETLQLGHQQQEVSLTKLVATITVAASFAAILVKYLLPAAAK